MTVSIINSNAALEWDVPGWWGGALASSSAALYAYDSSNSVYLADGTYAINATGPVQLNSTTPGSSAGTPLCIGSDNVVCACDSCN